MGMEELRKIEEFLHVEEFPQGNGYGSCCGYGDGYGDGSGDGYGSGYGSGYGYGSGDDSGDGDGSGDGYGSGDGNGSGYGSGYGYVSGNNKDILSFNGQRVYVIDEVATLIDAVCGQYAKGRVLKSDLTTEPCYIAKYGSSFAHGKTLKEAFRDAREKHECNMPLAERIKNFNAAYPDNDKPVPGHELFSWHHILTGSCRFGRETFCRERGLDLDAEYTVKEFIKLVENAYGSREIKQLKESRGI